MSRPNDLSRSLVTLDRDGTLIAVIEMGQSSWLVAGIVPGLARHPLKKLEPDQEALLRLLQRWQEEATKAGRTVTRIAVAFEAGRDGFWLARQLLGWPGRRIARTLGVVVAGEREINRRAVINVLMRQAPNDGQFVRNSGDAWQVLAELNPGRRGRNRLEIAAHIKRSVGLGIPQIDLTLPAAREDHDDRLRLAEARQAVWLSRWICSQPLIR